MQCTLLMIVMIYDGTLREGRKQRRCGFSNLNFINKFASTLHFVHSLRWNYRRKGWLMLGIARIRAIKCFSSSGTRVVYEYVEVAIISIESNVTFVPEVTMCSDRSSCWTRCSQSTTSTTWRAKVAVEAAAVAEATAAASGAEAAGASGIAAAARNRVLASRPTTRVRP